MKSFFKRFIKNQKGFEVVSTVALVALTLALARVIYTDVNIEVPEFTNGVGTTIGGIVTELENKGNGGGTIGCTHINSTVINTPGTCIQVGMQDKIVCLDCGFVVREGIPTGYGPHGKLNIVGAVSATCIKEGSTGDKICSLCQQVVEKATVIPATNHNYGDWIIVKDATCTAAGSRKKVCSTCSDTITETIKEKGHTPNPAVVENKVAATCTSVGSYDTVIYCSTCNDEISRTQTLEPMTPHTEEIRNKVDGYTGDTYCSVCGTKLADGKYIEYTITYNTDGGTLPATIVTKYTVLSETIKLPTPRKDKFIFEGWYETPDFRTPIVTEIAKGSTGDKVFYARWEHDISQVPAILAPRDVWYKGLTPRNQITEINIVDKYTPVGTTIIKEQWDASDASSPNSVTAYVVGTKLILSGNGTGKIFANEDSSYAFSNPDKLNGFTNLKAINGANILDVSKVTNAMGMFSGCSALQTIDVSTWKTTALQNAQIMFSDCSALTSLDVSKWDVSGLVSPTWMFNNCSSLTTLNVSNWNTSAFRNIEGIFYGCSSMTNLDVSNWDTANVQVMSQAFEKCGKLTALNLSKWNVSKSSAFNRMFADCGALQSLNMTGWNTASIIDLSKTFFNCKSLAAIDVAGWNTASVINMDHIFDGCEALVRLDLSNWDTSKVNSAITPFNKCIRLEEVKVGTKMTGKVINQLPVPDTQYIPDANGKWYAISNNKGYAPINIPVGVADTYTAVAPPPPMFAPSDTWYKGTTAKSTITEINIVDSYTPTGKETESWNGDVNNSGAIKCYVEGTKLTIAGNGTGKLIANEDSSRMFADCGVNKINGTNLIDTSNVTDMRYMFDGCNALTTLDVSNWNTSNVTNMSYMFRSCNVLTTLDVSNWNTSNVTNMSYMFFGCNALTTLDISSWNISNVTDMRYMFAQCRALTTLDVSNWDTSKVTNAYHMFDGCNKLQEIKVGTQVTSNVLSELPIQSATNIPGADGKWYSKTTNNGYAPANIPVGVADTYTAIAPKIAEPPVFAPKNTWYKGTTDKTTITEINFVDSYTPSGTTTVKEQWNADINNTGSIKCYVVGTKLIVAGNGSGKMFANSDASYMFGMVNPSEPAFSRATMISGTTLIDTSKTIDVNSMFFNCLALKEIDLSKWDATNITNMYGMFEKCDALTTIKTPYNIKSPTTQDITTKQFYDTTDGNRAYPRGTFPKNITTSHVLQDTPSAAIPLPQYSVKHYQMNLDGNTYRLHETETFSAKAGTVVSPAVKIYTGFQSPTKITKEVASDGSTVIEYRYARNKYAFDVNYVLDGVRIYRGDQSNIGTYAITLNNTFLGNDCAGRDLGLQYYGSTYELNNIKAYSGYINDQTTITGRVSGDTNIELYFTTNTPTTAQYAVKHYQMNLNGNGYTLYETEYFNGNVGAQVTPALKNYTGFTAPVRQIATVAADGSTVVNYYYDRNKYTLSLAGWLDGQYAYNINNYGTVDVYINNSRVATGTSDYFGEYYYGSSYEFYNVQALSGKQYQGTHSGYLIGTITNNTTVCLSFSTQTPTPPPPPPPAAEPPVMAEKYTWYRGTTDSSTLTEVHFVDSYTPTGYVNESWNADVNNTGSVKCYVEGTKLTIAGNGSGKIMANKVCDYMFASNHYTSPPEVDLRGFKYVTTMTGTNLLDMSSTVSAQYMFFNCQSLTTLDVSNWDVSRVLNMECMFYACHNLTKLDVSGWDVYLNEHTRAMFRDCHSLRSLDLSNWYTTINLKASSYMFEGCYRLSSITIGANVGEMVTNRLKSPDPNYILRADGYWYSITSKRGYLPSQIPVGVADTYVAVLGDHSGGTNGLPNKEEPGVMFSMFSNWKDRINSIFK